jgi:uncharacterized protein involved in exopolysaccharide biosynthesis
MSVTPGVRTPRDQLERLLAMLARASRNYGTILLVTLLGAAASVLVAIVRPRTYKSETVILYNEGLRSSYLGGREEVQDPAKKLGYRLKEMVLSRSRLQKIVADYKLYPDIIEDRSESEAVEEMRKHIAFRVRDGDTFGLSFEGESPDLAQAVTRRLAESLIEDNTRDRSQQVTAAKQFLDAEKKRSDDELKRRETELARFLAKHPEFAQETSTQAGTVGAGVRSAKKEGQKAPGDQTLLALEREAQRIRERLGVPQKTRSPRNAAVRAEVESEIAVARKDLTEKQARFGDAYPDVRAAKARLHSAEQRLARLTEGDSTVSPVSDGDANPEVDRPALESQLARVQGEISSLRNKRRPEAEAQSTTGGNWIVQLETEWALLSREVQEARDRNQQIDAQQFKAFMAAQGEQSGKGTQIMIIDPADKPMHPVKAGRRVIIAVGLVASLLLGIGVALVQALFDDRLYDAMDLEQLALAPLLVVVPRGSKQPVRNLTSDRWRRV